MTRCRTVGDAFEIRVTYEADGSQSPWIRYPDRLKGAPVIGKCLAYGGFRESSRIDLAVTAVRAERIQDMGFDDWRRDFHVSPQEEEQALASFTGAAFQREHARSRWDAINAARGFAYDSNPSVWVIHFEIAEVRR